jgi:hypothetical protein
MLLTKRMTASDVNGSTAILVSMKSHLGHSKVRSSEPFSICSIWANIMRAPHRVHRGSSTGVSNTSVNNRRHGMAVISGNRRTKKKSVKQKILGPQNPIVCSVSDS